MSDFRVRYSWINKDSQKQPKNTLVTMRKDDVIYFGISRCHLPLDSMNKKNGKELGTLRVQYALDARDVERPGSWNVDGTLKLHRSGMFGQVCVEDINKLLDYFDNLDDIMARNIHNDTI